MMGLLRKKSFGKWPKVAIVLLLAALIISAYFWITAGTSNSNNYDERYRDNPEAAVNILANGDVFSPSGYASAPIERNGNVYTLTADLNRELIISRSNIVFEGKSFTTGMQNMASNHQTIALSSVRNVTIKDVNIVGTYFGISIQHAQNNTIQNVTGGTINLWDSTNNIIIQSTATIEFQDSSYNTIMNCYTGGFQFSSSNYNSILNNNCSGSGRAMYLADSSNNVFLGNTFTKFWWWISMYGNSSNNTIVGNDIHTRQLYLADNFVGINYIYRNNFIDFKWNKTTTTNSVNIWSNNGEGNYWSDFNGTDANHDGISDTPYLIDATNTDSYPLMNPVDIDNELPIALSK